MLYALAILVMPLLIESSVFGQPREAHLVSLAFRIQGSAVIFRRLYCPPHSRAVVCVGLGISFY